MGDRGLLPPAVPAELTSIRVGVGLGVAGISELERFSTLKLIPMDIRIYRNPSLLLALQPVVPIFSEGS